MKELRFLAILFKTALASTFSMRISFLLQLFFMLGNNLIFLSLWWIFFENVSSVRGWQFAEMTSLMAILTGSYGLSRLLFGGSKEISVMIETGQIESLMLQPKNLLLHILASKPSAKGWGQLLTSAVLFVGDPHLSWVQLPLFLFLILCGSLIFTSIAIIAHSLVFWFRGIEEVSERYCDSLFLFLCYPVNIYSGWLKGLMFTLIPAGVIGYIPVELLKQFSWVELFILSIATGLFLSAAIFLFYRGLSRYESSSQQNIRF